MGNWYVAVGEEMKQKNKIHDMVLFSCEKWKPEKCRGTIPCQMLVPGWYKRNPKGCPMHKKSKHRRVPTKELTV